MVRASASLLVIGPTELRRAVEQALPRCRSVATDTLLRGLWTAGQKPFDAIIVALAAGRNAERAIRGLRQVAPHSRIIVACSPADEPQARAALSAGADEYVLEPLQRAELEAALQITPAPRPATPPEPLPTVEELVQLSEVLRHLGAGPQAALERLAALLQQAFDAAGVVIQVNELSATAGTPGPPVLEEPIRRDNVIVGSIAVAGRRHGSYAAADAARLRDYARLIETVVTQAEERAHWQELAWRDDLSGLRNRRYLDATLDRLLARAAAQRLRLTVVLLDIDDFKTYNDRFGHDTGDALLREVAVLLLRCSREHDVVARYGGDEFAVILWDAEKPRVPGSQHPTEAVALADRFRCVIGQHDFKCLGAHAPGPVTISGGLACYPWDGKTRAEILRAADEALLNAKRTGKNRIELAGGQPAPAPAPPPPPPAPPPAG